MATDINGISAGIVSLGAETARLGRRETNENPGSGPTADANADRLSLTDSAYNLRDLENRIGRLPATDNQRIDAIRRAVVDGSYQVDPAKTADKLLGMELALARQSE